jgi:hypothetical protein
MKELLSEALSLSEDVRILFNYFAVNFYEVNKEFADGLIVEIC